MELQITVSETFSLFAGKVEKGADLITIHPPEKPIFDHWSLTESSSQVQFKNKPYHL